MFFEEAKRVVWLGLVQIVLYASSDVVQLSLVFLESRQIFLDLLQGSSQSREFRITFGRRRRAG